MRQPVPTGSVCKELGHMYSQPLVENRSNAETYLSWTTASVSYDIKIKALPKDGIMSKHA